MYCMGLNLIPSISVGEFHQGRVCGFCLCSLTCSKKMFVVSGHSSLSIGVLRRIRSSVSWGRSSIGNGCARQRCLSHRTMRKRPVCSGPNPRRCTACGRPYDYNYGIPRWPDTFTCFSTSPSNGDMMKWLSRAAPNRCTLTTISQPVVQSSEVSCHQPDVCRKPGA